MRDEGIQKPLSADYYLWLEDKAAGPFTSETIRTMLDEKKVGLATLFCREGEPKWKQLGEMPVICLRPPAPAPGPSAPAISAPVEEWRRIEERAATVAGLSYLLFFGAGFCGVGMLLGWKDGALVFWGSGAGGCVGLGLLVNLVAQLLHVRAGLGRMGGR